MCADDFWVESSLGKIFLELFFIDFLVVAKADDVRFFLFNYFEFVSFVSKNCFVNNFLFCNARIPFLFSKLEFFAFVARVGISCYDDDEVVSVHFCLSEIIKVSCVE